MKIERITTLLFMIFFQKNSQMNISYLLKNFIQKVLRTENGLKIQLVSLQHVFKLGLETIVVFCSHYLSKSKEDVEKQVQSWGTDRYASFFVVEVDRFISSLKPKHEKIKLTTWYKAN